MSSISGYSSFGYNSYSSIQGRMQNAEEMALKKAEKFSNADKSQDGKLSVEEFENMVSDMPKPKNGNGINTEEFFTNADSDEDGLLTQEELDVQMEKIHSELQDKGSRVKEMMGFDRPPPPPPPPSNDTKSIEDIFASMDSDGDESVSIDELKSFLSETSTENESSTITETETTTESSNVTNSQIQKILSQYLSNLVETLSSSSNESQLSLSV